MSTTTAPAPVVTAEHARQFREEGYFLLPGVVPPDLLDLLRREAQYSIDRVDRMMDERGVDSIGINHRGKRYFSSHVWRERPQLLEFIKSPLMGEICRAALGDNVWLFWEQYVIKCADRGMKFSWHQDSGYVGYPNHTPYLTCWIALDDVSEENGTVHLLPYSRSGIRSWVKHLHDPQTGDLVGYFGSDPGLTITGPAGTIACFSSLVFHSSGANTTDRMRRVYLAQYAAERIYNQEQTQQSGAFEPVLINGELIDWRRGILAG